MNNYTQYLEALITEKGTSMEAEITGLESENYGPVIGLTYQHLVDFIEKCPKDDQRKICNMCRNIDFKNGDVFKYLHFLAGGMVKAVYG